MTHHLFFFKLRLYTEFYTVFVANAKNDYVIPMVFSEHKYLLLKKMRIMFDGTECRAFVFCVDH